MTELPLAGRRVLVTRAAHQAGKLSEELRALGAEPVEVPVLEIRPPESFTALDESLRNLGSYEWLVFSSANAVRTFAQRAKQEGIILRPAESLQVAAVGATTAAAVEEIGLKADVVPESYVAECLVAALTPLIAGKRVLLARAAVARDVIPTSLRSAGAQIEVVDAYRNVLPESAPARLRKAVAEPIDVATFTSSSTVTHLADAARLAGLAFPLAGVAAISIGPITSKTLREHGWEPKAEANPSDMAGLVAAVQGYCSHSSR